MLENYDAVVAGHICLDVIPDLTNSPRGKFATLFMLVAVVLMIVLGLIGAIISLLGVGLTPVLGIGLLIPPYT